MFRRKAKCECHLEIFESVHLPIKPLVGIRPKTVSPTDARAKMLHSEPPQPSNGVFESMIFEIEPLTNSHVRPVTGKQLQRAFWRTILAQQTHVEVPVVR